MAGRGSQDFCTANYFEALGSVDRNIRALIATQKVQPHKRSTTFQLPPFPLPPPTPTLRLTVTNEIAAGAEDEEEEAMVAFLCSGLPHYEGTRPVKYDSLEGHDNRDNSSDSDNGSKDEDEEEVGEWERGWEPGPEPGLELGPEPGPVAADADAAAAADAAVAALEGWVDFDELRLAVCAALQLTGGCRIGHGPQGRWETEYMLFYDIDTGTAGEEERMAVQMAKPGVSAEAFGSEILTLAYIGEKSALPVPRVLHAELSGTSCGRVGAAYAVVTVVEGEGLAPHWHRWGSKERRQVLDQIALLAVGLSELQLPMIGALVADSNGGGVVVGPVLDRRMGEPGYAGPGPDMGPFASALEFHRAMVYASLGRSQNCRQDRVELEA
ncbi:hypothetical protein LPJ66_006366, partial [Kickxella alabastrina]